MQVGLWRWWWRWLCLWWCCLDGAFFDCPFIGWLRMLSVSVDLPFHVWLPSHCCGLPLNRAFPRDPSGNNCFSSNEWLPLSGRTVIHVINFWISWQWHASSAECKWACVDAGTGSGIGIAFEGAARMGPVCFCPFLDDWGCFSVSGDFPFHVWLPSHCCGLPLNRAFPRDPSGNNCFLLKWMTASEWMARYPC